MRDEIHALLCEIRDNQREALAMQREHMALYQQQLARVERINDRAELIQGKARHLLKGAGWLTALLLLLVSVVAGLFLFF